MPRLRCWYCSSNTAVNMWFLDRIKFHDCITTLLPHKTVKQTYFTVVYVFPQWIGVMYDKWLSRRECIRASLLSEMRFPRLTSIIDCFLIRTEQPKRLKAWLVDRYLDPPRTNLPGKVANGIEMFFNEYKMSNIFIWFWR